MLGLSCDSRCVDVKGAGMKGFRKVWSVVTTVIVALVVLLAVALVGVRAVGLNVYTVLSGSMEPTYHVGSLIYVKKVPAEEIQVGDPITFVLNDSLVVATHRVIQIDKDETGTIRFHTKGDANESADGGTVHEKNLIGKAVFSIPYLGYVANFVQHPPGLYVAIGACVVLILLTFLPDLFGEEEKEKGSGKKPGKS